MNIIISVERYTDIYEEFAPLYEMHYDEIAEDKEKIPLDMDYNRYFDMDKKGMLLVTTVRDKDEGNKLIGYYKVLVGPHLHYKSSQTGYTDIFYIHPDYRKAGIGKNLFMSVVETTKDLGVQRFYASHKIAHDVSGLFDEVGLRPIEINYSIVFDKE